MTERIVYLMRGLPASGKSYTARRLAGAQGLVLETDEYFYSQVGLDPTRYDFSEDLLPAARQWILGRFVSAIEAGISPIVLDRGNGLNRETWQFARHAVDRGYRVELKEPESEWWQEIRVLLKAKEANKAALDRWAEVLADKTREHHRVPARKIREWMDSWRWNITVSDILRLGNGAWQ
jgi:hypothetical protein